MKVNRIHILYPHEEAEGPGQKAGRVVSRAADAVACSVDRDSAQLRAHDSLEQLLIGETLSQLGLVRLRVLVQLVGQRFDLCLVSLVCDCRKDSVASRILVERVILVRPWRRLVPIPCGGIQASVALVALVAVIASEFDVVLFVVEVKVVVALCECSQYRSENLVNGRRNVSRPAMVGLRTSSATTMSFFLDIAAWATPTPPTSPHPTHHKEIA